MYIQKGGRKAGIREELLVSVRDGVVLDLSVGGAALRPLTYHVELYCVYIYIYIYIYMHTHRERERRREREREGVAFHPTRRPNVWQRTTSRADAAASF